MSGRLWFVILMYSFYKIQVQALLPPKLMVNSHVITEADSVTLNCLAPSPVSVSQCYFYTVSGGQVRVLSCLQTLTGTELLRMAHQTSPAEVKVICFYTVKLGETQSPSPHSDPSSISIQSLPPKLMVNSHVITEADSVTLNCQTPSPVSVSQCYFYTVSGGQVKVLSCLQTLTGTELLRMAHQTSPAEVKVKCYYTVKLGEINSPSPHSDPSSITIHKVQTQIKEGETDLTSSAPITVLPVGEDQKPQMSVQHFSGEHILFTCSLPLSSNHDIRCNLYFGEASRPVLTTTIWRKRTSKTNQSFCQFTVRIDDLLRHLHFIQQSDASCDYSLRSDPNSLSPRSDGYSLRDITEKESSVVSTKSAFTMTTEIVKRESTMTQTKTFGTTTGVTVSRSGASTLVPGKQTSGLTVGVSTSTPLTSMKPASGTWIWKFTATAPGCGVIVGVILLVSAILCNKRRAGSKEVKGHKVQNDNLDIYLLYSTISEEPAASAWKDMVYSTAQGATDEWAMGHSVVLYTHSDLDFKSHLRFSRKF
ncbi:uncharacterized protein [Pempheris klunzingeri]|uniref:uncharacterized protein n=1 Tax=Pempheris klunzingeri TaxID=3127111 RepID=UPI00398078ED